MSRPSASLVNLTNQVSMRTAPSASLLPNDGDRSKLGIQKMDSLESNFSFHFAEAGLEMPIQVEAQELRIDPTGIFEEWGDLLGNPWAPNFYY